MIGRIQGTLIHKLPPILLVDVHGIGYEIAVSMHTLYEAAQEGQLITLYTYLCIREDAHALYGFATMQERALFKSLLKVSGVGPKSALAILSAGSVSHFQRCVEMQDIASLTKIPGIGKKTAERLVMEMRDSLQNWGSDAAHFSCASDATPRSARGDAISALISLGYKAIDATKVISRLDEAGKTSEILIREALRQL